jgi:hypothetical protein
MGRHAVDGETTMTSQLPIETLANQIKAHIAAGDKAQGKADQHYLAAGLHLVELKLRTKTKRQFEFLVQEQVQIGVRRAYSLIAVAEGRETLEQQRERNRTANKAHRARKSSASHDAPRTPQHDQSDPLQRAQEAVQALSPDQLQKFVQWFFRWKTVRAAS